MIKLTGISGNNIDITPELLLSQLTDNHEMTLCGHSFKDLLPLIFEYQRISGKREVIAEEVKTVFSNIASAPKKKVKLLRLIDPDNLHTDETYIVNDKPAKIFTNKGGFHYLGYEEGSCINVRENKIYEMFEVDEDQVTPEFIKGLQ